MKKVYIASSLLSVFFSYMFFTSCAFSQSIDGNGHLVTKNLSLGDYEEIRMSSSADVMYSISSTPEFQFTIDENMIEHLDIYVKDKTLHIAYKRRNNSNYRPTKFVIKTSSSALSKVQLIGSGDFIAETPIQASGAFNVKLSGSGDMSFPQSITGNEASFSLSGTGDIDCSNLRTDNLKVHVSGTGDVKLKGAVAVAEYSVSGTGDIKGYDMNAEDVKAHVSGVGEIELYASKQLSASVSGVGDIYVKGNPDVSKKSKSVHFVK